VSRVVMHNDQKRSARRFKRVWTALAICAAFLITLVGAFFFIRPFGKPEAVANSPEELKSLHAPAEGVTTFLLIGADQRPGDVGRADTMIVGSYDEKNQRLAMVSIPRDTFTYVKGHGFTKINHSYAYGGPSLAVQTAQQLIGMPIDHYVVVNFQGFMGFIDALGGVDINAEKRLYYVDPEDTGMGPNGLVIDIQPGPQRMNGYNALGYARFRMDEEGDRGRMRRQQQVIEAVVKEIAQPSTFAKIPKLIPTVFKTVETDMTTAQMVSYGLGGKGALSKGVAAGAITGADMMLNGIYYMVPNMVEVRKLVYETLMGTAPPADYMAKAADEQALYERSVKEEQAKEEYVPQPYGGGTKPQPTPSVPPSSTGKGTPGTGTTGKGTSPTPTPAPAPTPTPTPTPTPPPGKGTGTGTSTGTGQGGR
jgi:LCP family protein required for cell wall assembly